MRRGPSDQTGFSLLELVVVVAIFSLVAVMSVQALKGTLRSQQFLGSKSDDNFDLTLALARLRLDLESAVPLKFRDANGVEQPALVIDQEAGQMKMSVAGMTRFNNEPAAGLGRIEWRLDAANGQIMRRYWPTLIPGRAEAAGAEVTVMDDVRDLDIWTFSTESGWVTGWLASNNPDAWPLAIRVVIETGALGRIELVERL